MNSLLYTLSETVCKQNYAVTTYHTRLPREMDTLEKVATLVVGQTIGTWIPIPGITEEVRERYVKKVMDVFDVPSLELATQITEDQREYLIQVTYPSVDFSADLSLLIMVLLGSDTPISTQTKFSDIEFSEKFVRKFRGSQCGIKGIQNFVGINDRPILLNMIKPYTGLIPKGRAGIFYETILGSADSIKDDELPENPVYSRPEEHVKAYREAARAAYKKTGERVKYLTDITSDVGEIIGNVKRAEGVGTNGLMINSATTGYNVPKYVAKHTTLPILGHSASIGVCLEGTMNGMTSPFAVGKLVHLVRADIVMINTPYEGYPLPHQRHMQIVARLALPFYDIKSSMPPIGGGVRPGMMEEYIREVGKDVVLAAGGAIQGYPCGAAVGARAIRQAIDTMMNG